MLKARQLSVLTLQGSQSSCSPCSNLAWFILSAWRPPPSAATLTCSSGVRCKQWCMRDEGCCRPTSTASTWEQLTIGWVCCSGSIRYVWTPSSNIPLQGRREMKTGEKGSRYWVNKGRRWESGSACIFPAQPAQRAHTHTPALCTYCRPLQVDKATRELSLPLTWPW